MSDGKPYLKALEEIEQAGNPDRLAINPDLLYDAEREVRYPGCLYYPRTFQFDGSSP